MASAGAGFSGDREEVLLDLYSGTGTIALCLASKCGTVYGVESNQHAVDDAMENARHNCITNAHFLQADLSRDTDMAHVAKRVPRPDIVVAGASLWPLARLCVIHLLDRLHHSDKSLLRPSY